GPYGTALGGAPGRAASPIATRGGPSQKGRWFQSGGGRRPCRSCAWGKVQLLGSGPSRGSCDLTDPSFPPPAAKPPLLGKLRPRRGVVWGHHRVIVRQIPLFAVLLRRKIVVRAQMPLQRLELLSILQTHDVVRRHRFLECNCRAQFFALRLANAL